MKLSKITLNKYAEAVSRLNKDQSLVQNPPLTKGDMTAAAAALGTQIAGPIANYAINRINDSTSQENAVGNLFGDFARQQFKNRKIPIYPVIENSYPRALGTQNKSSILEFLITPPAYSYWAVSPEEQMELNLHALRTTADKITGDVGFVTAPRNNISILAHELGHLENAGKVKKMRNAINSMVPRGGDIFEKLYNSSFVPFAGTLGRISPRFHNWLANTASPDQRAMVLSFLGMPAPVYLAAPLAISQTVRDTIRQVLPFKTTDDVMNFVEDHPAAVAASGFMPQLLNEMHTAIPGYRLTRDFYKHLNSLNPAELTPELAAQLGDQIKNIGKFRPNMEALRFLGHNILANSTYAIAPITAAAFAYLNRPRKDINNE